MVRAISFTAALALAVLFSTGGQAASIDDEYFAPSLQIDGYSCDDSPVVFPALSSLEVGWYGGHLRAAQEPSLYQASLAGRGSGNVHRFTWLRSFHKPIIVRVDESPTGEMRLTAKRLSGKGGYEPGRIEANINRSLTAREASSFRGLLATGDLAPLQPVSCDIGFDGAQWIVETSINGDYRFLNRWGGSAPAVRAFGMMLLSFTGWNTTPLY